MKKKISALLALTLITASTACYATSYQSSLSIPGNSTHNGETRQYDAGNMRIGIQFNQLNEPDAPTNRMVVMLEKKKTFGHTEINRTDKDYPNRKFVTSEFGYQSQGEYRFSFSTQGYPRSGGNANFVVMGNF